jgi:hypothetical protein
MRAGAPVLIRTDTVSGRVWKLELRGGGDKWVPFIEPDAGPPQSAARDTAPQPAQTEVAEREIVEPPEIPVPAAAPAAAPRSPRKPPATPAPDDIEIYVEALQRPELTGDIRAWVVTQLALSNEPRVTEALLGALDDSDTIAVLAAVEALWQRDDPRVRPALEKLRNHPDAAVAMLVRERLESVD